jgi:prepilin-type N-terminal cleavage/methylation domain-containing protein
MKNKSAFTLVELIIVIAIIAILAAAIFVAIDPARRLHESRNARRRSDISTIVDAIKTNQADNNGDLYSNVASLRTDYYYQIGITGDGCARTCVGNQTETNCLDLTAIGSTYLTKVPFDPKGGSDELSGYVLKKDAYNAITVIACDAESEGAGGSGAIPDISTTR